MTNSELYEEIRKVAVKRLGNIKKLTENKTLEDPIKIDLVRVEKCMGFEDMLEILRKKKKQEES